MLNLSQSARFDELSVAVPDLIRYPTIRTLAERIQQQTLDAVASSMLQSSHNLSRRDRVLDSLYQTPIADASILACH